MAPRVTLLLLLLASIPGCVVYEYEHEFWLKTDGSGTVYFTGRPPLWAAFKGLRTAAGPEDPALKDAARALFERSGLRVSRVRLTWRGGRPYLFVSADFDDVNRLSGTPAFPDLQIALRPEGENLRLEGRWSPPPGAVLAAGERDGLMAVRFHLPSKIYDHKNAFAGVERGNIVAWRQTMAEAAAGRALEYGALLDRRSILLTSVALFGGAIVVGLATMATAVWLLVRRGRRTLQAGGAGHSS